MKATLVTKTQGLLIGVILEEGTLILESSVPRDIDSGYPTHAIGQQVSLTTGSLAYWINRSGSVPVYEGDTVKLQF